MTDVIAHWLHLLSLLQRQRDGITAPAVVETTRQRVRRFYEDADQEVIKLPRPRYEDPAFEGLEFSDATVATEEPLPPIENEVLLDLAGTPSLTYESITLTQDIRTLDDIARIRMELERRLTAARAQSKELQRALGNLRAREKRMTRTRKIPYKYRPSTTEFKYAKYINKRPGPCWCGCGEKCSVFRGRKSRFVGGAHVMRYTMSLVAVERGNRKREELPELMRKRLKWVRCQMCFGWIPNTDPLGRPIERRIGISCWRERMHVWWPYTLRRAKKVKPATRDLSQRTEIAG